MIEEQGEKKATTEDQKEKQIKALENRVKKTVFRDNSKTNFFFVFKGFFKWISYI